MRMHALVLVIGDKVHEQLEAQLRKHIDFYMIGGRWEGILPKLRDDGTIKDVDSLRAGEIAWQQALAQSEAEARSAFAKWREIFERHGRPKRRAEIADALGLERDRFGHFPAQVYEVYRDQPAMLAFNELYPDNIYCPINAYGFDEEKFVEKAIAGRLTPHALVIAGKWVEGPMGLDEPEPQWVDAVRDRLRSLPPDTRVTAVDVHF
jgi:hypothetical protein